MFNRIDVQGDPVNFIDPEGFWVSQAIGGGVGAAYGMYAAHQNGTSMLQGAIVGGALGGGLAGAGTKQITKGPLLNSVKIRPTLTPFG